MAGWDLSGLTCSDPDDGSSVAIGDMEATIDLDPGETVACVFTNTQRGAIEIVKQTDPEQDPQDFAFTTTGAGLAEFALDVDEDETLADRQGFDNLLPGPYTITEAPVAGWDLTDIDCSTEYQGTTFEVSGNSVTITLAPGDDTASCTFVNTKDAFIIVDEVTDPAGDPAVFDFAARHASRAGRALRRAFAPLPGPMTSFTLSDGSTPFNSGDLDPGPYSVTQFEKDGWDLADSVMRVLIR